MLRLYAFQGTRVRHRTYERKEGALFSVVALKRHDGDVGFRIWGLCDLVGEPEEMRPLLQQIVTAMEDAGLHVSPIHQVNRPKRTPPRGGVRKKGSPRKRKAARQRPGKKPARRKGGR